VTEGKGSKGTNSRKKRPLQSEAAATCKESTIARVKRPLKGHPFSFWGERIAGGSSKNKGKQGDERTGSPQISSFGLGHISGFTKKGVKGGIIGEPDEATWVDFRGENMAFTFACGEGGTRCYQESKFTTAIREGGTALSWGQV